MNGFQVCPEKAASLCWLWRVASRKAIESLVRGKRSTKKHSSDRKAGLARRQCTASYPVIARAGADLGRSRANVLGLGNVYEQLPP